MRYGDVELYNIRETVALPDGGGVGLSRVPGPLRRQLSPGAQTAALSCAGAELRFNLEGESATVWLQRGPPALCDPTGIAEVWFGPFAASYELSPRLIGPAPTAVRVRYPEQIAVLARLARERGLPWDPRLVRVVLPYDIPTSLLGVEGAVAPPRPGQSPLRRYLAYGSSITHGGNALAPTDTYAQRVARGLGYDLLGFGFAGSAQLEPALADYLAADLQWDVATLELGINVLGLWTVAEFAAKVDYFVSRIAGADPERWVWCTDLFTCLGDIVGSERIAGYRAAVRDTVARLNLPRLRYLDGRDLLPDPIDLTTDLVHPAASGMEEIAARILSAMRAAA